jgi:DNA-binding Xre family transcriptional regulator
MTAAVPGESARILASLKRILRAREITYAELGRRIRLSEASVKRVFSRATLTLRRLEQMCEAVEVSIQEVARLAGEPGADRTEFLTLEQEKALATDPRLFACYYLIANGRAGAEIAREVGVDERTVRRWMVQLQSLRLVTLRSRLRAQTLASAAVTWRADGPVRRMYERQVRTEFLQSAFAAQSEALHFRSAELSDASCRVYLRKLERLAAEFRDLAELDRAVPSAQKRSVACLLAIRPWVFSMFESLRDGNRHDDGRRPPDLSR